MNALEMRLVPDAGSLEIGGPLRSAKVRDRCDEEGPVVTGPRRGGHIRQRLQGIGGFKDLVEDALSCGRSDARQEVKDPKPRNAVTRVLDKAQKGQDVLDVGGFQKFQAAEFDERDIAASQLDFERTAVRRGTEEHSLLLQQRALLSIGQDLLDHISGLIRLVSKGNEVR